MNGLFNFKKIKLITDNSNYLKYKKFIINKNYYIKRDYYNSKNKLKNS